MNLMRIPRPVVLLILDGWGLAPAGPGNAVSLAETTNFNSFWAAYPHTQLTASGEAVGLPRGEPGNTETGHLNLGAGQIVYQDLLRINMSIADGSFYQNKILAEAARHASQNKGKLHIMGLIGAGGVHSNIEHLFATLSFCKQLGLTSVYLHLFTDGRDSPPTSAPTYISQIRDVILREGVGRIATVMGRYYAMDRDLRWERTERAYRALVEGEGNKFSSPEEAIQSSYDSGKTDEFVEPAVMVDGEGKPLGLIGEGDAVIFFNFRIDRPRQLTKGFCLDDFENEANLSGGYDPYAIKYFKKHEQKDETSRPLFKRSPKIKNLYFVTLTEYQKGLPVNVAYPPQTIEMPLSRIVSDRGLRQLHASESEKERFVTFFFNGQRDGSFPGEDRLIIPSPKVATYDLMPQMSALVLTERIKALVLSKTYDFMVVNFANPDMVGHTGVLEAAIRAVETTDKCVGEIARTVMPLGGCVIVTADHGNVEEMINPKTGQIDTEHSSFPVPFILLHRELTGPRTLPSGILADVAPTVLSLMQIQKPPTMFGRSLLI